MIRIPIKPPLFHGKSPARFFFCGSPGQLVLESQLGTSKFFKFISCHQLRRGALCVSTGMGFWVLGIVAVVWDSMPTDD